MFIAAVKCLLISEILKCKVKDIENVSNLNKIGILWIQAKNTNHFW